MAIDILMRTMQVRPDFVRTFGPNAAILLELLIEWNAHKSPLKITQDEIERFTGLNKYHQREARRRLRAKKIIKEHKCGIPSCITYSIDLAGAAECKIVTA